MRINGRNELSGLTEYLMRIGAAKKEEWRNASLCFILYAHLR